MKMIIGAFALALAVPGVAQTAPAADPHAGHQMSADVQGADHSQHQQGQHNCKECCEKMKGKDAKMECMDKAAEAKTASADAGTHQGHAGH